MSFGPHTRRRHTNTLVVVNCAFAEDCRCSKMGYVKRGFMENHLERVHPSALGLTISAPYCPACDTRFASKGLLIDHIMDSHVLARMSSFPARAVSARAPATTSSQPVHDAAIDYGGRTNTVDNQRRVSDDTFALWTADFPTSPVPYLNIPTNFSYLPPADRTAYTHLRAQRFLPPTPMIIDPRVVIQGNADQGHDDNRSGRPEHG
jgi:hypothetical protein